MSEETESLEESIEEFRAEIEEEEKEAEERARREEREKEEFWENERERQEEKEGLAEEILDWCEKFANSEKFRKLVGIDSPKAQAGISGLKSGTVWIYTGGWGHEREDDGFGRWARLNLRDDGSLLYTVGYKWMCPIDKMEFETAEEMAEKLTKEYLEELREYLLSGDVYDRLQECLD